jgi:HPt (histidine-containing phosphotransfer) domain-containing protein
MTSGSPPKYLPGINLDEGLERFFGNWETFLRLMKYFIKSHEVVMSELHNVLSQDDMDFDALVETAHKIKGAAANLSAVEVRERALRLEQSARKRDAVSVRSDISNILRSFQELRDIINNM